MEPEKSNNQLSVSWRTRDFWSMIQVIFKSIRTTKDINCIVLSLIPIDQSQRTWSSDMKEQVFSAPEWMGGERKEEERKSKERWSKAICPSSDLCYLSPKPMWCSPHWVRTNLLQMPIPNNNTFPSVWMSFNLVKLASKISPHSK
jgi:hypothetical protein